MDCRSTVRKYGRFCCVNSRSEHDDQISRPSTSRGNCGYSDGHNFYKNVAFKVYQRRGNNNFRKSWDNKTNLVRQQLDGEFSNRNEQSRNSFVQRNYNRVGHGNCGNSLRALKTSSTGFYSIYVPNVENSEETMKIIQSYITHTVFCPYNIQYFDNGLRFLVDDFKVASALYYTSYKVAQNDRKLIIKVNSYAPPRGPISFTPVFNDAREKMIEAIAIRYNPSTKSLDLSRFYRCPLFIENQLFVPLNQPAVLLAALNIVAQHSKSGLYGLSLENNHIYLGEGLVWIRRLFPDLKVLNLAGNKFSDLKELKDLSGFTIEVLNLSRNPVCDTGDKTCYRRDVQQLFPILQKLDNSDIPYRYNPIVGTKLKIPINLGNSYPLAEGENPEQPNTVKILVEAFLSQFYEWYDNKVSRQLVADAYHENATFSLSSCVLCHRFGRSLAQYKPLSRNMLKDITERSCFMHSGRENITNILEKLPKTKHDLVSIKVDVPFVNRSMIQIVLNGVFAEEHNKSNFRQVFRSFSRTFAIVPIGSSWKIISDMLFVTIASDEIILESSKRFYVFNSRPISKEKKKLIGNNNNVTMFMEDTEEMSSMQTSYQQLATHQPAPYLQQSKFSPLMNPRQTSFYQGSSLTPSIQIQNMALQQENDSAVVSVPPEISTLPNTSLNTPAHVPVNKPLIEMPSDTKFEFDWTMINAFSTETGMNYTWAAKCLKDNNWDYARAAFCFKKIKPNIPSEAFIIIDVNKC